MQAATENVFVCSMMNTIRRRRSGFASLAPLYRRWQWRNFVPYQLIFFAAILWVKLWEMFVIVIALKYALLVTQWSYGHFLKLIQFYLNNTINLRRLTQRIMSCYTHKMAIVLWP